jgi:hypothetical protein
MKTVSLDIETVLDEEAAARCSYVPSGNFAPFTLHQIACASALSVTRTPAGEMLYALESFSLSRMSERAIIASVEETIADANTVSTFNGCDFDLPVLGLRAMVHEVYAPKLVELQNRSRVGRHCDLLEEIRRCASPVSLAELCAPFAIPVKQAPGVRVAELVGYEDWATLEAYCETDAVACWLATQFWNNAMNPGDAREAWRRFADWAEANAAEHPSLAAFINVPGPPRASLAKARSDEIHF